MLEETLAAARAWLEHDPDPATRAELQRLIDERAEELAERFAGRLEFGTAGLRGVVGAGPQRMNVAVVRQTTAGLADYLLAEVPRAAERGVVIGYDGRLDSRRFAEDAARVLRGRGVRAVLGREPLPTPVVAFAVLDRGAAAGVAITASHNPPEYNGYKVFWGNGAQIIPPHDAGIAAAIARAGDADAIALGELGEAEPIDDALIDRYLAGVATLARVPVTAPITIAYTAMHGVGAKLVERALAAAGFTAVHSEPSQREPDGRFPTVAFPNPEEPGAMDRVVALARRVDAELVIANDPDADRLAIAARRADGGYLQLTGDQVGALLADYLIEHSDATQRRLVATTIVSSQLLAKLAAAAGVDCAITLTGLKWIANTAIDHKAAHGSALLLGYEEALGYCIGELIRDKDGVSAAVVFAELAAAERARGRSVLDRLDDLYRRHGVFLSEQKSLVLPGAEGAIAIAALMTRLRAAPPATIAGHDVLEILDLHAGALGLPRSNVLVFRLAGDRRVIMRPSGTEPKLKSYYEVCAPVGSTGDVAAAIATARADLTALRDAHQALLRSAP